MSWFQLFGGIYSLFKVVKTPYWRQQNLDDSLIFTGVTKQLAYSSFIEHCLVTPHIY